MMNIAALDMSQWALAAVAGLVIYSALDALVALVQNRRGRDALKRFQGEGEVEGEQIKLGSQTYQVRAAFQSLSMDVSGQERLALITSSALLGGLMGLGLSFFLELLLALPIGLGAGYGLVQSFIRSRWAKVQIELEKEIPTLMRNLSGILQTDANPIAALQKAARALQPGKPLSVWIRYFLDELHARGASPAAWEQLQKEASAISTSLGLCVFEISRMAKTGGSGYARAFQQAADNLSQILEVRAEAHAEAKSALGLAKLIIAVAVGIYAFLALNPAGAVLFRSPRVKVGLTLSVVWGVLGWFVIQRMVEEALS